MKKFWLIGWLIGLIVYGIVLLYPVPILSYFFGALYMDVFVSSILFFVFGVIIASGIDIKTKRISAWLKGGIVGILSTSLLYVVLKVFNSKLFFWVFWATGFTCIYGGDDCQMPGVGISLFFYFILGAIIGWIYGKIRNKNRN